MVTNEAVALKGSQTVVRMQMRHVTARWRRRTHGCTNFGHASVQRANLCVLDCPSINLFYELLV